MNLRFLVAAFCLLTPLCPAQSINGEATYVSFSVPGAVGTYPMSINSSMAITGYYYVSATQTRGFVREADGAITTFDVDGGVWTGPESINAGGDITGFYEPAAGIPQGFLRYADGRILTFDPAPSGDFPNVLPEAQPVSINDFDEIVGNYPYPSVATSVFTRSREGVLTTIDFYRGAAYGDVATAINASGDVVGYWQESGEDVGFVAHPDGFFAQIALPVPSGQLDCTSETIPYGINAGGTIAGWYLMLINNCNTKTTGGFVLSPDGVYTLFNPPGTLLTSPLPGFYGGSLTVPHWMSIDQAGDIAGSYVDATGAQHGFVRNPYGTITTFDPPKGKQTTSTSINDGGAITGFYQYSAGTGGAVGFIRMP